MTSYYVYYRVEATRLEIVRSAVQALFAAVEKQTGVRGRWMRRPDDSGTYMEIYEGVRDQASFEAALQRESASLGLERHTEHFIEA
ncbi:MAG: DUF4936 family protein [Burkholderiales bacterium]